MTPQIQVRPIPLMFEYPRGIAEQESEDLLFEDGTAVENEESTTHLKTG